MGCGGYDGFDGFDGVDGMVGTRSALTWKFHLVPDGVEWRRMVASMGAGALTQRALTWKSLCVPSGEGGTHRRRLVFASRQRADYQLFPSLFRGNEFCDSFSVVC